jgi:oligoendopeptidase F
MTTPLPERPPRHFLPEDLSIQTWDDIAPFFEQLVEREIHDKEELKAFLLDVSELEAVLEEDAAWRYIKMTIDTTDEERVKAYQTFVAEIQPKIAPMADQIDKKICNHPLASELKGEAYAIYLKKLKKSIDMFREKNVELRAQIQNRTQEYGAINGGLNVEIDEEQKTLQQAGALLQSPDRNLRKEVFDKIHSCRSEVSDKLNALFSDLVGLRNHLAKNADYPNFRDYKFDALARFDYTKEDCFDFHESIAGEIVPLIAEFKKARKERMGLESLKPWDLAVDPEGREALKPFKDVKTLVSKSIEVFTKVLPEFGEYLDTMDRMGHLDLESKKGKAPGGYNYPLYEIGVPFIFMNAVGTQRDLVTMMHEGGHAVHSFLNRQLELSAFKSCPSEVAELASMSMELLSMDHWDIFYSNPEELKRAKMDHLEDILSVLPWIAIIDAFQHWIYTHPAHSFAERTNAWEEILNKFDDGFTDWSGCEEARKISWQKQLHLFEVPFYYIEYGMAQLGAIMVYRAYRENSEKAIQDYRNALELGYTKSIGKIYETAGIRFDFSRENVRELAAFVRKEIEIIKNQA